MYFYYSEFYELYLPILQTRLKKNNNLEQQRSEFQNSIRKLQVY